jgi:GMP synthase-like glutamine amidotransferase
MTPRIHYLQHVAFEGLGTIQDWAVAKNALLTPTLLFEPHVFPLIDAFDWLIIMGGPMGVYDEAAFTWLKPEKRFIEAAINAGKTVIGVCLGAQLIASALGARIFPNRVKEIGWFPINWKDAALSLPCLSMMPKTLDVFHWHGDTFDLPHGAVHLARSAACENQAFAIGDKVFGFQFHLEVKPENVREMIAHCGIECVPAEFVQSPREIVASVEQCSQVNGVMGELLSRLT